MATGEPEVNLSHPSAIPPIDPRVPRIVHPMGEFGQESYIDLGYASPAKYPKSKRKNTNKQDEGAKKKSCIFPQSPKEPSRVEV